MYNDGRYKKRNEKIFSYKNEVRIILVYLERKLRNVLKKYRDV
jgi:hypothetical protein